MVCLRFAVAFYGKEKSMQTHLKLPVKTDQDTLREGYRYVFLIIFMSCCAFPFITCLVHFFRCSHLLCAVLIFFHSILKHGKLLNVFHIFNFSCK